MPTFLLHPRFVMPGEMDGAGEFRSPPLPIPCCSRRHAGETRRRQSLVPLYVTSCLLDTSTADDSYKTWRWGENGRCNGAAMYNVAGWKEARSATPRAVS